jgi:ribonuclease R
VHRARIRSVAQLAFPDVEAFLARPQRHPIRALACADSVRLLPAVGAARAAEAARRHVVRTRRGEIEVKPGSEALPYVVREAPLYRCEADNAQLSLLCNAAGGAWLAETRSEGIWRVHPRPGPEDLDGLERLLGGIAAAHGLDGAWIWRRDQPLDPWVAALPAEPWRVRSAMERQAQIANRPSSYAAAPGLHHGVGADAYARFSAPMREIVGVQVHREAVQRLTGATTPGDDALRDAVIASANRARQVQRELDHAVNLAVLDALFERHKRLPATVVGADRGKLHVRFDDPPVDAKVYLSDLAAAWGGAALDGATLRDGDGRRRAVVGGAVTVEVGGWDPARRRWALRVQDG